MQASQIIKVASAANAATIGVGGAVQAYNNSVKAAHTCTLQMSLDDQAYLEARTPGTCIWLPEGITKTDHPVLQQARVLTHNVLDSKLFVYNTVTKVRTLKDDYRALVIGATVKDLKRYKSVSSIYFWLPSFESKDNDRNYSWYASSPYTSFENTVLCMNTNKLNNRCFIGEFPTKHFDVLIANDSIYNITQTQLELMFKNTGAKFMWCLFFAPDELILKDKPGNPVYTYKEVYADYNILVERKNKMLFDTLYAELLKFKQRLFQLDTDVFVVNRTLHVKLITGDMVPYDQFIKMEVPQGEEYTATKDGQFELVKQYYGYEKQDMICLIPIIERINDIYKQLMKLVPKKNSKLMSKGMNLKEWFKNVKNFGLGAIKCKQTMVAFNNVKPIWSHGYVHDVATWANYLKPAFDMEDFNLINEVKFSSAHIYLTLISKTISPGPVYSVFKLHEDDYYVKILDLDAMYKEHLGIMTSNKYISVRHSDIYPLLSYLESLKMEQLYDLTVIASATTWLRRNMSMVQYTAGVESRTSPLLKRPDYHKVVLAAVLHQQQACAEWSKQMKMLRGGKDHPLWDKFKGWFATLIEDTKLDKFIKWLVLSRYYRSIILPCSPSVSFLTILKPKLPPIEFMNKYIPPTKDEEEPEEIVTTTRSLDESISTQDVETIDCDVCKSLDFGNYKLGDYTCSHAPTAVRLQMSDINKMDLTNEWKQTDQDPVGLKKVKEEADAVLSKMKGDFDDLVDIYYIVGPPGTGKSHLIRTMIEYKYINKEFTKTLVVAPFSKLMSDYHKIKGPVRGTDLSDVIDFKTTHRAITATGSYNWIFVDECGALDARIVCILAEKFKGAKFVLAGDHNQTQLRETEGRNLYKYLDDIKHDITKLNTHCLLNNYRNPGNHVPIINRFTTNPMVPKMPDKQPIHIVFDMAQINQYIPNWKNNATVMTFSKKTWNMFFDSDPVTVRSCQGSSFTNVVLIISSADKYLIQMGAEMPLVALSRHKEQLVIYAVEHNEVLHRWLSMIDDTLEFLGYKIAPGGVQEKIKEGRKLKVDEVKDTNYSQFKPEYDITKVVDEKELAAVTDDVLKVQAAKVAPMNIESKPFTQGPDANQALTGANVPKEQEKKYRVCKILPNVVQYLGSTTDIEKAAIARANKQLPMKGLQHADRVEITDRVTKFFNINKIPGNHFELQCTEVEAIVTQYLRDAQTRHYLARLHAENDQNGVIAQMDYVVKNFGALVKGIQRINVKPNTKVGNLNKETVINKAGQAISSMPISSILQTAIGVRILTYVDSQTYGTTNRGTVNFNYGKTTVQLAEDMLKGIDKLRGQDPFMPMFTAYMDGKQTDSGGTLGSQFVFKEHFRLLMDKYKINWPWFNMELVIELGCNMDAIAHEMKFTTTYATPSGYTITYILTTIPLMHFSRWLVGEREYVHNTGGDDNAIQSLQQLNIDPKAEILIKRITNIELTVVFIGPQDIMMGEFCGTNFGNISYTDGIVYSVAEALVRKYEKLTTMRFKDYEHFSQVMISLRDWLDYYLKVGHEKILDNLLFVGSRVLAHKQFEKDPTREINFSDMFNMAKDMFAELVSYSRTGKEVFEDRTIEVSEPANPLYNGKELTY